MGKIFEFGKYGHKWVETDYAAYARTPGRIEKLYCSLTGEDRELFRRVCTGMPCPREFMRKHMAEFGWNDEIMERARIFTPRPLPNPVRYYPNPWHCYENSRDKALAEGILYVEGLTIVPGGPIIHAWNSTDGQNVVDYSLPCQHLNRYFGVIIDLNKHADACGILGWYQHYAGQKR